jgi:hypothetical protein
MLKQQRNNYFLKNNTKEPRLMCGSFFIDTVLRLNSLNGNVLKLRSNITFLVGVLPTRKCNNLCPRRVSRRIPCALECWEYPVLQDVLEGRSYGLLKHLIAFYYTLEKVKPTTSTTNSQWHSTTRKPSDPSARRL